MIRSSPNKLREELLFGSTIACGCWRMHETSCWLRRPSGSDGLCTDGVGRGVKGRQGGVGKGGTKKWYVLFIPYISCPCFSLQPSTLPASAQQEMMALGKVTEKEAPTQLWSYIPSYLRSPSGPKSGCAASWHHM